MARFSVGEIAIWVPPVTNRLFFGRLSPGDEVEVVRVGVPSGAMLSGPGVAGNESVPVWIGAEYECRHPAGYHFCCFERDLRKRPSPGLPAEVLSLFDVPIREVEAA